MNKWQFRSVLFSVLLTRAIILLQESFVEMSLLNVIIFMCPFYKQKRRPVGQEYSSSRSDVVTFRRCYKWIIWRLFADARLPTTSISHGWVLWLVSILFWSFRLWCWIHMIRMFWAIVFYFRKPIPFRDWISLNQKKGTCGYMWVLFN